MQDRLIFPTRLEQIATRELVHDNFPAALWTSVDSDTSPQFPYSYISDIQLDVTPRLFFEWAYRTPGGTGCGVLFYCLNLSMELLMEPTDWMLDVVVRANFKQLTDGSV